MDRDGQGFDDLDSSVHKKAELADAIQEMIDAEGPYLLDVQIPYQEHVLPMIPSGMTVEDLIKE